MPQAEVRLPPSHPSVERIAGQINTMIAERAGGRLYKASVPAEPSRKPQEPGVYFNLPAADYHADPSLGPVTSSGCCRPPQSIGGTAT